MVVDGMHADMFQAIDECSDRIRDKWRRQYNKVGRAEIKRLVARARTRPWMLLQKFFHDVDHPVPQTIDRRVFADIHTRQLLRQHWFMAGREAPVGKVVGKSLPDEMVFLQRAECVLEDGVIRTSLQRLQQLRKRSSLFPTDPQQVLRGIEIKWLRRLL